MGGIALFVEEVTMRTRYKLNSIDSSPVTYDILKLITT